MYASFIWCKIGIGKIFLCDMKRDPQKRPTKKDPQKKTHQKRPTKSDQQKRLVCMHHSYDAKYQQDLFAWHQKRPTKEAHKKGPPEKPQKKDPQKVTNKTEMHHSYDARYQQDLFAWHEKRPTKETHKKRPTKRDQQKRLVCMHHLYDAKYRLYLFSKDTYIHQKRPNTEIFINQTRTTKIDPRDQQKETHKKRLTKGEK